MDVPKIPGYEILEVMPHGGMSTVYKARQISLDRVVVLKTLSSSLASDTVDIDKFLDEARLTAKLRHPNIVQVYDFGRTKNSIYYFVMEFVSGYTVGDWIRRKGVLSEEDSLVVAQSVADALGYASEKLFIIHCDIKPDNVIIDGDGTIKVADLGLARSIHSMLDKSKLGDGIVYGTPNYISPEQSRGDPDLDGRADIYSLGAMLYHCMTGSMPFHNLPALEVMDCQITDQIPDTLAVNPSLSVGAAALIEIMMAKDRDYRQPNWNAVLRDFSHVLHGEMPLTPLPPPGASTVMRTEEREHRLSPKVTQSIDLAAPGFGPSGPDTSGFRKMRAQFEAKRKTFHLSRAEWWFAGVVGGAALLLIVLFFRIMGAQTELKQDPDVTPTVVSTGPVGALKPAGATVKPAAAGTVSTLEAGAKGMFDDALKWSDENPSKVNEAIKDFEKVAREAKGTKYSIKADREIERLKEVRANAMAAVLQDMKKKADACVEQAQFDAVAAACETYDGPWSAETKPQRDVLAKEFRNKPSAAEKEWQTLVDAVSDKLIEGDAAGAIERVSNPRAELLYPLKREDVDILKAMVKHAAQWEQTILDSFRKQATQYLSVGMTNGVEKLIIGDVEENRVVAVRVMEEEGVEVKKSVAHPIADLSMGEKRSRLASVPGPDGALMAFLMAIKAGDSTVAEVVCPHLGEPLSISIPARMRAKKGGGVPAVPPQDAAKTDASNSTESVSSAAEPVVAANPGQEKEARHLFIRMLRTFRFGVPEELPDVDRCVESIQRSNKTIPDRAMLEQAVTTYRARFGKTEFGQKYDPVLKALLELRTSAAAPLVAKDESAQPPPSEDLGGIINSVVNAVPSVTNAITPGMLRNQLLQRNPGVRSENMEIVSDEQGRITAVTIISPFIRDIQPLAACAALTRLTCAPVERDRWYLKPTPTLLENIMPLRGLPLKELILGYTNVKDIFALSGMKSLVVLDLSYTRTTDFSSLRDLKLRELRISHLQNFREVRILGGMPLESLDISSTSVADLGPLLGKKLKSLDISNTDVMSVSVLRDMPLSYLAMQSVKTFDFSPLANLPLNTLMMAGTSLKDLSVVAKMPLQYLDVSRTKIKVVTPLRDMKTLKSLRISGTEVKDLTPLSGLPLKYLSMDSTPVVDISPLSNCPLSSVDLDFEMFPPKRVRQYLPTVETINGNTVYFGGGERNRRWK